MLIRKYVRLEYSLLLIFLEKIGAIIQGPIKHGLLTKHNYLHQDTSINMMIFTQKGYIQFVRYIEEVPTLSDYTFCIWVRSHNLTFSHPLLSYSLHEEERLIRAWISPHGENISLEILGKHVFEIPVNFKELQWYHVCQSWSSYQAAWNLFINGKLRLSGSESKLRGVKIKGGGDIVVGQEYTDFDKGLDDGIEGDIFGFNFVLSSTSIYSEHPIYPMKSSNFPSRSTSNYRHSQFIRQQPLNIYNSPSSLDLNLIDKNVPTGLTENQYNEDVPSVLSYFDTTSNRKPKDLYDVGRNIFNMFDFFPHSTSPVHYSNRHYRNPSRLIGNKISENRHFERVSSFNRIANDVGTHHPKPLGLQLVELSFNCGLGRGAPLSGKQVLVSWTKSTVRVFGGAIIKTIPPFCTKY